MLFAISFYRSPNGFVLPFCFLRTLLYSIAQDPAFDTLGAQLEQNNIAAAFDTAHLLKGIIANTGLTPLHREIVQIVEPLRGGSSDGVAPHYAALMEKRNELLKLLN